MDTLNLLISLKISEMQISSLHPLLTMFEELVVLGLSVEVVAVVRDWRHELYDFWRGITRAPENPGLGKLFWGLAGTILIVVGVGGEVWIHVKSELLEVEMRDATDLLVAKITKEAEDERYERLKIEDAVAWRTFSSRQERQFRSALSGFAGQLVELHFPDSDMEAFSFSSDIAESLRRTKWVVIPPNPNEFMIQQTLPPGPASPIMKITFGIAVLSTPDDKAVKAGRSLAKELCDLGFDAGFSPAPQFPPPPSRIWVTVWHRPRGPQGEAKLRQQKRNPK